MIPPMKVLIVEDDFTARKMMLAYLSQHAQCDVAVNGKEALRAFKEALIAQVAYDLICLDISMPEMDGQETLVALRQIEKEHGHLLGEGVKVIMTTALGDNNNIMTAFSAGCEAYLVKPIGRTKLLAQLEKLGLMPAPAGKP